MAEPDEDEDEMLPADVPAEDATLPADVPAEDALEQIVDEREHRAAPNLSPEVPEADALEQAIEVPIDDDEVR
jgi:hypothetical protein